MSPLAFLFGKKRFLSIIWHGHTTEISELKWWTGSIRSERYLSLLVPNEQSEGYVWFQMIKLMLHEPINTLYCILYFRPPYLRIEFFCFSDGVEVDR